ncbi:MAG: histidinol-phosphate transaminase [Euryarchaeota archaeon]|nr:histidinol-phosphate transaminase [Euryarchaeota archaeon]
MKKLSKFIRKEIRDLEPCVHGGEMQELLEKGFNYDKILDFSANTNPLGPSPKVINAIRKFANLIHFYPDSKSTELRKAISNHLDIDPASIIIGNGSSEIIWLITKAFLNHNDNTIIPIPTFGEYEVAVKALGGNPIFVHTNENCFSIDTDKIIQNFDCAKLLFLCNPNDPTGKLISQKNLLELIKTSYQKNLIAVIDEAYIDFCPRAFSSINLINKYPNIIVLRSLTKAYGLAGLRVGYAVANKEIIKFLNKVKLPWNVNFLAQIAAIEALKDKAHLKKTLKVIQEGKNFLISALTQFDFKVYPSDANFFLIDVINNGFTPKLQKHLLKKGILIRDCSSFRGLNKNFIRISVRTKEENMKLMEALKELV